jgi:hypothetical protein
MTAFGDLSIEGLSVLPCSVAPREFSTKNGSKPMSDAFTPLAAVLTEAFSIQREGCLLLARERASPTALNAERRLQNSNQIARNRAIKPGRTYVA